MYDKIVIGLDQSYTRTGISIAADGELVKVTSLNFKGCKTKSDKRRALAKVIIQIIEKNQCRASSMVILLERVRTFSHNQAVDEGETGTTKGKGMFISTAYIKATGALIGMIVDTAAEYGIKVYSVDTRAWMSKVLGSSKGSNKQASIKFITKKGFNISSVNKKGDTVYDDDAADSGCIALYGFVPEKLQTLKLEE